MAHYTDAQAKEILAAVKPILKKLSKDADETFYDGADHVEIVEAMPKLDDMPSGRQAEKARSDRDESLAYLEAMQDLFEEDRAELPVDHGQIVSINPVTSPDSRGNRFKVTTWSDGFVEKEMLDRTLIEAEEAKIQLRINERDDIRSDLQRASELGKLAAQTDDGFAANTLRAERDELMKKATERRDGLRAAIEQDARARGLSEADIGAEIRSYDLPYESWLPGRTIKNEAGQDEQLPGPREAIQMLRDNKFSAAYEALREMDPQAKMQFWKKAEEAKLPLDALLEMESGERSAAAEIVRLGGGR